MASGIAGMAAITATGPIIGPTDTATSNQDAEGVCGPLRPDFAYLLGQGFRV